jgi:2-C-methyl-D-erythritol 2,4-cyclodiphosphate synthase
LHLLAEIDRLIRAAGFVASNVDATVVIEHPKLRPHVDAMRTNMASVLGIDVAAVSVKATTSEGLGFVGAGDGAAAHAVCLLAQLVQSS